MIRSEYNVKKASEDVYKKTIRTYHYAFNNLSKIEIYNNKVDSSNFIGSIEYDNYDNKKNPYSYLFLLQDKREYSLSVNNFQSKKYHYKTETYESGGNVSYTYQDYTEEGYPTTYPDEIFDLKIEYFD